MKILSNGSERLMLLSWEGILSWRRSLGEAGLLRGHVAPLLDDGLLDRSGVGSGPGADLLGDIDTLLDGGELGHQFGHVLAGPWMSQSLRRGVLQISTVSLKAICSYSMKQLFLKFSSHSSSCWES